MALKERALRVYAHDFSAVDILHTGSIRLEQLAQLLTRHLSRGPTDKELAAARTSFGDNESLQFHDWVSFVTGESVAEELYASFVTKAAYDSQLRTVDVRNRKDLLSALCDAAGGEKARVQACMCSYMPPAQRLIIRDENDIIEKLGTTVQSLHNAADKTFWAYNDFDKCIKSFELEKEDKERRVLGIEGVGSKKELLEIIATGKQSLCIGHLSHNMMMGKVEHGEWKWIDEETCVMHTATAKPGLLRKKIELSLSLNLRVLRHEKFLDEDQISEGDLVIFDINPADVRADVGNQNAFCQDPEKFTIAPFSEMDEKYIAAVDEMMDFEVDGWTK